MKPIRTILGSALLLGLSAPSCAVDVHDPVAGSREALGTDPGSLLDVEMQSQVGVLLDEVPASMRSRVAADLLAKPASFWIARAKRQIRLATYRLVFREFFYGPAKKQLPLPPESVWQVALVGNARRVVDANHDTVVVDYRLDTTILSDAASPAISEPKLAKIGGTWNEPFTFPIDPELLFQRTGYACMDEEDFPFNSVESEEVDTFYDQDCTVEHELSSQGCHQTVMPDQSCKQALIEHVGKIDTSMKFTRLAWDATLANSVRAGVTTSTEGADMQVYLPDFTQYRVEYKYFEPGSCELQEQCIGAPGWRRVLQFNSSDENTGNATLDIGAIDYYLTGEQTLNDLYNIFELHECHAHYHFTHYGAFSYAAQGAATTHKQGFCLQSTDRVANHELSPLHNPYGGCDYQGVSVGWVDQYKIGLPCQWVDVTDVDTSQGPVTAALSFESNPDGFLCEGTPVLDGDGNPVFEPTEFTNDDNETVYRPMCEFSQGWDSNNEHSYDATVPSPGESFVTLACDRGQVGPLRNCGFAKKKDRITCAAGAPAVLHCELPNGGQPQVVRLCERSDALGTGLACRYEHAVANASVEAGAGLDIAITCPAARSATEPGGAVSLYVAPVYDGDASAKVTCTFN